MRRILPWLLPAALQYAGLVRAVRASGGGPDTSLGELLRARQVGDRTRRLAASMANDACTSVDGLSVHYLRRVLGSGEETGRNARLAQGYDRLIEYLAEGVTIVRGAPVTHVHWSGDGVRVEAGRTYTAPKAVITLPLGVLQAGTVQFDPELPTTKREAIAGLRMHPGIKVLMRFDRPMWPGSMSYLVLEEGVLWPPRPGEPILVAFVMGPQARSVDIPVLCKTFGESPVEVDVADWGSDPWTRGGYSSEPPGAAALRTALAEPCGPLHFAGEATDHLAPGTVGAAVRSGERAAEEIPR